MGNCSTGQRSLGWCKVSDRHSSSSPPRDRTASSLPSRAEAQAALQEARRRLFPAAPVEGYTDLPSVAAHWQSAAEFRATLFAWAEAAGIRLTPIDSEGIGAAGLGRCVLLWDTDARTFSVFMRTRLGRYVADPDDVRGARRLGRAALLRRVRSGQCAGHAYRAELRRPWDVLAGGGISVVGRVARLIISERSDLIRVAIFAMSIGVLSLATPIAVQSLFNTVAFGTLMQPLFVLAFGLLVALGLSAVLKTFEHVLVEFFSRRLFIKTAVDFSERAPSFSESVGARDSARLLNRFLEVVTLEKAGSVLIFDGTSVALQMAVGLLLLAVYHPLLLAFDLVLVSAILFAIFFLGRGAVETAVVESKKKHRLMGWIQDVAEGRAGYRSAVARTAVREASESMSGDWLEARRRHYRIHFRQLVLMFGLQVFGGGVLLVLGGALVIRGQLTLGQLVAAEIVVATTTQALGRLGKLFGKYYDLCAALDKIGQVVDAPLACETGDQLLAGGEAVRLRASDGAGGDTEVAPGAYLGPENCAGDRLAALVHALQDPKAESPLSVELDRQWLSDLAPPSYWREVALFVPMDGGPGTLRARLDAGPEPTPTGELRHALAMAGLEDWAHDADALQRSLSLDVMDALPLETRVRLAWAAMCIQKPRLIVVPEWDRLPSGQFARDFRSWWEGLGDERPTLVSEVPLWGAELRPAPSEDSAQGEDIA